MQDFGEPGKPRFPLSFGRMSDNPYSRLPDRQFWRRAIGRVEPFRYDPVAGVRFTIGPEERVATAGSCFAQHISRRLAGLGFNYFVTEAGEELDEAQRKARNHGVFSARFGNLYTTRQLLQLFEQCFDGRKVAEGAWQREDGRFVDALRPQVEPEGFAGAEDVLAARATHLAAVRRMFEECAVFVFTLGLTEAWRSREDGTVYPMAPGVSGGSYSPERHEFVNFDVLEVMSDLDEFLRRLKAVNPSVRVLLTVSPVPLIATYEDRDVLVATTYSKSVLRVAADMAWRRYDWVDYFPSYEIITGNYNHGAYYEDDLRGVNARGVDHAMRCFLANYTTGKPATAAAMAPPSIAADDNGLVCDEEELDQARI
jgi:hypothetical protein